MPANPLRFMARRLASGIFVLLGVSLITFTLAHLVPVNPVAAWIGKAAAFNPHLVDLYTQRYHLNDPVYLQYFYYLNGLLHLDLGFSPTRQLPVIDVIGQTLPYTLQLLFFAILFVGIIGTLTGIVAARYANRLPDRIISGAYIFAIASPSFFIALLLILVFSLFLPVLPTGGPADLLVVMPTPITSIPILDALIEGQWGTFTSMLSHVALPSLALAITAFGLLTRVLRSNILDLMSSNFIRASRARGISENKIFFGYAFKNSLVSVVTLLSVLTIFLLVGDIFVEDIFSYPGIGQYAVQAALSLDYPAILGTTMVYATIVVIVNLIADILYAIVDPRIRYG